MPLENYRDTELARMLLADEAAGRLQPGTIREGSTLAETLLETAGSGGDPEIVRMAQERIDWPRDEASRTSAGNEGPTILHQVAAMDGHVQRDEVVVFAIALLAAGVRLVGRDSLLRSTLLGWACR